MSGGEADSKVKKRKSHATPLGNVLILAGFLGTSTLAVAHLLNVPIESALKEASMLIGALVELIIGTSTFAAGSVPNFSVDAVVFMMFSFAIFFVLWTMRLTLIEPLTAWSLGLGDKKVNFSLAKFSQVFTDVIVYGLSFAVGLRVVLSQSWVWPSANWWEGYSNGDHMLMRPDFRCYYLVYTARYFQDFWSLFLHKRRKDFWQMLSHHVLTVAVGAVSYAFSFNRIGAVVMVLHDPSDVLLNGGKCLIYINNVAKRPLYQFLTNRIFEVFAVVFFTTKIILFSYVCWSAHIESLPFFPHGVVEWSCVAFLYGLLALQFWWFGMIVKLAMNMGKDTGATDTRSSSESEKED